MDECMGSFQFPRKAGREQWFSPGNSRLFRWPAGLQWRPGELANATQLLCLKEVVENPPTVEFFRETRGSANFGKMQTAGTSGLTAGRFRRISAPLKQGRETMAARPRPGRAVL